MSLAVFVSYAVPRAGLPAPRSFRRWVEAALAAAGHVGPAELAIRVVAAEEGKELNRCYRGRDYATNVLSFPVAPIPGLVQAHLGDLAICAPVVAVEAAAQHKSLRDHYAHLCVHGVLHLLGFDHVEEAQAQRMETLETGILAGLGIPDPYAESAAD